MRALFLTSSVLLCGCLHASTSTPDQDGSPVISNSSEWIAKEVFIGHDHMMPERKQMRMSMTPSKVHGEFLIPKSFPEAFVELDRMLPKWFKAALVDGHGDQDCSVTVNDIPYDSYVYSWVEVNWRLRDQDSDAGRMFIEFGIKNVEMMKQALQAGFCLYLKEGEAAGIEAVKPYADP